MLKLRIQNFRKLRDFSFEIPDEEKVTVVNGYNEAGKSTLVNAIKLAVTGEAYGRRGKTLGELTTHGQSGFSIQVKTNHWSAHRTDRGGDTLTDIADRLGVPQAQLSLVFDAKMAGDGGNKALKDYLNGTAETKFDPAVVFKDDAQILACITSARRAGKLLTGHIVTFCEAQRAASKAPDRVAQPNDPKPNEAAIQALTAQLAGEETLEREQRAAKQEAFTLGSKIERIAQYLKAVTDFDAAMRNASSGDPLGSRRDTLMAAGNINVQSLEAAANLYRQAGYAEVAANLAAVAQKANLASADARATLQANPRPPAMPVAPVIPADAVELFDQIKAARGEVTNEIMSHFAAMASAACTNTATNLEHIERRVKATRAQRDVLVQLKGAWADYEGRSAQFEAASLNAQNDWARWDRAAKSIQAAEKKHIEESGKTFAALVSSIGSNMLQGRKLVVSPIAGISLDGVSISEVSESTKWRMEIVVMASVAYSVKSPLLLIDGFDILDHRNRKNLYDFVGTTVAPYFEHTIMTATPRQEIEKETGLAVRPAGLPVGSTIGFWTLDDVSGAITRIASR